MNTTDLTASDRELVDVAKQITATRFVHGSHYVGAALKTVDGDIFTGINVETNIGRAAVCAEPVAIGTAITQGNGEIETIASVRHPAPEEEGDPFLVSPCGVCREMITDMGRNIEVIFPDEDDKPVKARAIDLLPNKYIKSYRSLHTS